jgi:ornithine carbamoyltransferase
VVCTTAAEAVAGADIVYTDSWMSYGVSGDAKAARFAELMPFQVMAMG